MIALEDNVAANSDSLPSATTYLTVNSQPTLIMDQLKLNQPETSAPVTPQSNVPVSQQPSPPEHGLTPTQYGTSTLATIQPNVPAQSQSPSSSGPGAFVRPNRGSSSIIPDQPHLLRECGSLAQDGEDGTWKVWRFYTGV
ncbi:uncharacterized protein BDR25DRAFT_123017 [Lindgomyces ingoldianus]|uniref:Uncharacterized protein n=1 Tax=Lindgomyces ingoldianus TaxID=673940 RepID=A0ACB6Q9F4_9PLEO|nr:uncharacterized protein BDR25DRAFT_123017 [Lindgomyces ingoldianus]KAF2462786.1 hypothetical protein BDR25DRAFT_123017 [Lindgomyces ingoldianus]